MRIYKILTFAFAASTAVLGFFAFAAHDSATNLSSSLDDKRNEIHKLESEINRLKWYENTMNEEHAARGSAKATDGEPYKAF